MSPRKSNLTIVFNSLNIGGIETKIIDLCSYYATRPEITVSLILKNREGLLLKNLPSNISIYSPNLPFENRKLRAILFPIWLALILLHLKPSLAIAFGNYSAISTIIGKLISRSSTKVIISEDSSIREQLNVDSFPALRKLLVKLTYPLATSIITLTTAGKNKLLAIVPQVSAITVVLPNWLPLRYKNDYPLKPKDIDILFLARFEPQKNPLAFLKIITILTKTQPTLKVVMVGEGSLQPQITSYIAANGLHNNISLQPVTTDPREYYLRSKLLVLTSVHEGFPLTILEGLALGCVPVCSQIPELTSFFSHDSDRIFYSSLQKASGNIRFLLSHNARLHKILKYYQQRVFLQQQTNFDDTIHCFSQYL